ncbi:hypothetical protein [Desulfocicer vacuolatum]|uniref:hypothetical protein n=1 Tax=Desulfocicer vacuolatum TaxID=2298 RepID=UPI001BAFA6D2|nr:hypothetical protein [Desulfocicer vacuolatum]
MDLTLSIAMDGNRTGLAALFFCPVICHLTAAMTKIQHCMPGIASTGQSRSLRFEKNNLGKFAFLLQL